VKGRRAYKLAREGKDFELKPRKVFIKEIEIIDYKYPFLKLRVITGKGVYIRSLARDIGKELGTGGYASELKRTRVGNFTLENSISINRLEKIYRE
jgi:tRNA pseudouridine55 synthase